ncbi:glutamate--cysteine ligase [Cellulosimicrobium arenosum]|uniref:Putative glutamate--cysteine ligase 2 n=1 Tax=Cellulosimicrobium arenosum TaxID=2708133 RepID=A0A927G754_9MICO|nr:glutamate--cysteine ligase [Cellulosimicrobium arenosum]MBD8077958.1 glutamate--cysteine ligase [Cellulosimicrobium arenosum]
MGVEEEFLLVGEDGRPVAKAAEALAASGSSDEGGTGSLESEFMEEQIETATHPQSELEALAKEIRTGRGRAQQAADRVGAHVAALSTSPLPFEGTTVSSLRYLEARTAFGLTAREQLTCGCHVHVAVADDTEGVAVLDRIGPWLATLLALTTNSPYWQGIDSSYASFRSQVWSRWPTSGPARAFGSPEAYHDAVDALVATGTILDQNMVYFDARLSARYPTVEIRIADVCLHPDTATLVAALARGLVETAAREAAVGLPAPELRTELLRTASWRAGRSGLAGDLVSPTTWRPAPAHDVVGQLVTHVREALVDSGDLDAVTELLGRLWSRGNGAARQREWYAETGGDLSAVVRHAVEVTHS